MSGEAQKNSVYTAASPLSLQINFHMRTFMMVSNRKHADIIIEKLPSTLT